jgi:hypothetical protein
MRRVSFILLAMLLCFQPVIFAENLFEIVESRAPGSLLRLMKAIHAGADVNQPGKDGQNLLTVAICNNCDRTVIRALINAGAMMDEETERTVMQVVAYNLDASLLR